MLLELCSAWRKRVWPQKNNPREVLGNDGTVLNPDHGANYMNLC